jgi:hypothetical protein
MAKQVEHMSPAHMKQYAGAFVQQQMGQGRSAPQPGRVSGPPPAYKPVTHLPRKDHFHQYKVQQPSRADSFMPSDPVPGTQIQPGMPQQTNVAPNAALSDYDFFMSSQQPPQKKFPLPGSNSSLPIRIGLVAGGLIVLLIVFNIVKGLLAGPSNFPYYMSVIQDQQEITHLSSLALQQEDLSTSHKNFAATSQVSVKSAQSDLVKLLIANKKKVDDKQANLKVSTTTDARLETALASGTYNTIFNEVMQEQLATYKKDLNTVYNKTQSQSNRRLLKSQYDQADLLIIQLGAASPVAAN